MQLMVTFGPHATRKEEGGVGALTREIGHVKLECHSEIGGDGGPSLLDNAPQKDGVVVAHYIAATA